MVFRRVGSAISTSVQVSGQAPRPGFSRRYRLTAGVQEQEFWQSRSETVVDGENDAYDQKSSRCTSRWDVVGCQYCFVKDFKIHV